MEFWNNCATTGPQLLIFLYICGRITKLLQTCEFNITVVISEHILSLFPPISLDEMNSVKLLDRLDKKYTFPAYRLDEILEHLKHSYKILEIDGLRYARYETCYFDTPDFEMYTKHHNRKLNRYKVRFRTYLDSGLHFFEVKFKTNKGRTIKKRRLLDSVRFDITGEAEELLLKRSPYKPSELQEAIRVYYKRITLVSNDLKERVTIDSELSYQMGDRSTAYPNMIIAEVKQDKSGASNFIHLMNDLRIKDISISKYCLGVASLAKNIKTNNFKIKILHVKKLCSASA